ncbi:unnamed protein product [Paramecium pentaurelia]|uniref:Transmembrane protein n=1 Tax=Paramecium pentaurelia TaxID=43138 RepID=A0A8S1WJF9_9CILI|nr:unnamed protein product [Paramecium pentaurelia]
MLNKFTLQFKDKQLEEKYQNYQLISNRLPLFKHLTLGLSVAGIIRFCQILISGDSKLWFIYVLFIIGVISLGTFVLIKKKSIRIALVIINHLIILTSLEIDNQCSPHYYYLRGASMMCIHLVILLQGEFIDAFFSIIIITTIRLLTIFLQDSIFPYPSMMIAIILIGYLLYIIYKNNLAFRSQFQLSCLDNQWDQVITTLIDDPYLLINFNESNLSFKFKKSNKFQFNCENELDLKLFLRNTKLIEGKNSLEQFLFKSIQDCIFENTNQQLKQQIQIIHDKKEFTLQYSIFLGVQPLILIQVLKFCKIQIIEDKKFIKLESSYQFKYKKLLSIVYKRLNKMMKKKSTFIIIHSMYKQILYFYLIELCEQSSQQIIYTFKLQSVLKKIKMIYNYRSIQIYNSISSNIMGNKSILCLILIDVIEQLTTHNIKISCSQLNENEYQIKIEGVINDKAQNVIYKRLKTQEWFFKKFTIDQSCIKLILWKDLPEIEGQGITK